VKNIKSNFVKLLIAPVILVFSQSVMAGDIYDAVVTGIYINSNAISIRIQQGVTNTAQPSCATGSFPWAISVSPPIANKLLTLFVASKTTGTKLRIVGTGQCTVESNKENISHVQFVDGLG